MRLRERSSEDSVASSADARGDKTALDDGATGEQSPVPHVDTWGAASGYLDTVNCPRREKQTSAVLCSCGCILRYVGSGVSVPTNDGASEKIRVLMSLGCDHGNCAWLPFGKPDTREGLLSGHRVTVQGPHGTGARPA